MKRIGFIILIVLSMILVVGCGNDNTNNAESETDNDSTNNEESNDNEEDVVILNVGETGEMETTVAEYEITPTNVEVFKEKDGETPFEEGEEFILIDFTLKNTGDEPAEPTDLIDMGVVLENEEFTSDNQWGVGYDFVNELEEEIEPGEEVTGQLLFELDPSDSYELHFGWGLSTVSTQIIWEIKESDIN